MDGNTKCNKRWWFAVYRVLKDADCVRDLHDFEKKVKRIFNNHLPVKLDIHDLSSKVSVMSLDRTFEEWDPSDAPFSKNGFRTYQKLVQDFKNTLKSEQS